MGEPKLKPALVLDDDRDWAAGIARGIRRFGGLPVTYFPSIEALYRHHEINYGDKQGLAHVLEGYSVVVSDNNFETPNPEHPGDGYTRGVNFLLQQVGPALESMPKENRPIVMCFAPSSMSVLCAYEQQMWDKYNIISFHKTWETAAVGLTVRIAREYGVLLSRESIISHICQQNLTEDDYGCPKADFFFHLRADHTIFEGFPNENSTQVEGDANPMEWEDIVASLASRLKITSAILSDTIDKEVQERKREIEGQGRHPEKGN